MDEVSWIDAMLHPQTKLVVRMSGLPFRFAPRPGWRTAEQRLDEHLIYFVVSGRCRGVVAGKPLMLEAGHLCWVCPGVKFCFFEDPVTGPPVLQRFRLSVSRRQRPLRLQWDFRIFPDASDAVEWARSLVTESEHAGKFDSQRAKSLAALFAMGVFESHRRRRKKGGLSRETCVRISRHVLEHASARISPADLARVAGFSADYFSRRFRVSFDASPREWLLKQRLRHAAALLVETDWRISEVAARLGYPDLYLFSRQFRKEFGNSPRAWRQMHNAS
jgi:AraC-like DNA-binding protein